MFDPRSGSEKIVQKAIDRRNKDAVMGLGEHLEELRRHVLWALLGLLPILAGAMIFGKQLVALMIYPAISALRENGFAAEMQNTGPLEFFSAWFKVSLIVTVVLGAPWVCFHLWRFIAPGLYDHERRFAHVLAPLSAFLSIAGLAMMYFVMLPTALSFLVEFSEVGGETIAAAPLPEGVTLPLVPVLAADPAPTPPVGSMWFNSTLGELRLTRTNPQGALEAATISVSKHAIIRQEYRLREYVDLFFGLALAFVIAFQTPVVVLLLGWAGIINRDWLGRYRRHAIVVCALVGAVVTPTPDPLSMMILVVPMYLLYELGGVLLWLLPARRMAARVRGGDDDPNPPDATGP